MRMRYSVRGVYQGVPTSVTLGGRWSVRADRRSGLARPVRPRTIAAMPRTILLAWPRGYCAGVERAVDTVERALRIYGAPVYVRKQIVHNIHVVRDLEGKG